MEPITWNVLAVVVGALAGLITALGTWSVQRGRLEQEAKTAVATAWAGLCQEQQERIEQLQNHIERLQARVEKMQQIAEALQDRVIALEAENAQLRIEMKTRDGRIAALESENNCLRGAK
jgi:peptidoglycan hydrolase CwlO-like protein